MPSISDWTICRVFIKCATPLLLKVVEEVLRLMKIGPVTVILSQQSKLFSTHNSHNSWPVREKLGTGFHETLSRAWCRQPHFTSGHKYLCAIIFYNFILFDWNLVGEKHVLRDLEFHENWCRLKFSARKCHMIFSV